MEHENEWATVLTRIAALESAVAALMLTPATPVEVRPEEREASNA